MTDATTTLTRVDRSWLKEAEGAALYAVLCAPGFNIRWLMRAIDEQAARAAKVSDFVLFRLCSWLQMALGAHYAATRHAMSPGDRSCGVLSRPPWVVINMRSGRLDEFRRVDDVW